MRQSSRREIWEAAKVVGAAVVVILLSFGIALVLAEAVSFPERQRVEIPANPGAVHRVHRAGDAAIKPGRDPYALPDPGGGQESPGDPARDR